MSTVEWKGITLASYRAVCTAQNDVMVVVITFSVSLQREVVDSIVQGYANKYTIDAKDIAFQVPNYSRT